MTHEEFQNWLEFTKSSETQWIVDVVTFVNRGEILVYRGGVDGIYLLCQPDGTATIGTYEGAMPHIGEAVLRPGFSRNVSIDALGALLAVYKRVGIGNQDLMDLRERMDWATRTYKRSR